MKLRQSSTEIYVLSLRNIAADEIRNIITEYEQRTMAEDKEP
ncbi:MULTISPECIES: hypothetical protein [Nostocales]|uniref:Transposase n=2 Tax=Nostocales TaxID=1161 RepID=A0ABW8WLP2_9CYAN|nr:hypothetical protein [Tolypothrix bouteillei]